MKQLVLAISCLLLNVVLFSQNKTITGLIKDKATGEPLPGVNILEKSTGKGTISNVDGTYDITISGDTLVFSFIGFQEIEEVVGNRRVIDVLLESSISDLQEVVVTALGLERSSKDLGYAVQQLDAKSIAEVKSPNFLDNLAGQVAGVTVNQGATGVGSTSKITIRGEASFTNNNPLFIVDGTPINNNSVLNFTNEAAAGFQEVDFGNGAMEVNSDDIASVTVLKGPSAAALYGTRAANGVVIITTKDGSDQEGIGISVNSTTFLDRPFQLPQFQNAYGQGNSGQFEFVDGLGGGINDNITYSWGPRFEPGLNIAQFDSPVTLANGTIVRGGDVAVHGGQPITPSPFEAQPNNLSDFYETGVTTINNVAIASRTSNGNYRLSFTDLQSTSIIPGVNLDRTNLSARFSLSPIQKLKVNASINFVNSNSDNRPANGYGSENVNYSLVAWGPRSLNIDNLRDYWQPGLEGLQQYSFNYTFFDNPFFILEENRNSFNRDRLFGNISASYYFTPRLSLTVRSGMDYSNELRAFRRNYSSNRFVNGAYAEHSVFFREVNTDFLLSYNDTFGDFSVDISLGGNRMDQTFSTVQNQTIGLAQPGIFNLSNAATPLEIFEFESKKRINSFYGIAKLGYKNFLFLDITGRNDWSSALATPTSTSNTSFFYPSFSGSFILSNVLDVPEAFSFVKLRASWAEVGNDTDPFQTTGAFIAQTPYNNLPTFSERDIIPNANLLPEETTSFEFGGDIRLFDDRLRFDITYYNALTKNQILSLPVAISSGFSEQVVNGGAVRSKGLEVFAGIDIKRGEQFNWTTQFNFSRNVSRVTSLPDQVGRLTLAYSRVYDNVNQTVWFQVDEGGQIGDMYGTGYAKNENGDFIIDENGNFIADNNLIKLGNYNPDFTLGFSNQFSYKNWDLGFLIDWRQGGILVSRTLSLAAVGGQLEETANRPEAGIVAQGVVNTGTPDSPIWEPNTTPISAERFYRQFYDRNHEENNVYNGSFLKLRQFSIGYTFKSKEGANGFFSNGRSLRIALIGRNLFAISDIPHFDPEQLAVQGTQFVSGVEDMSYASTRSFGLKVGLNL